LESGDKLHILIFDENVGISAKLHDGHDLQYNFMYYVMCNNSILFNEQIIMAITREDDFVINLSE
jgi:hypothetical protein